MATSNLTYNQIKDIFKSFSSRHLQLNDFYFGEISEIGNSKSFNYPLLSIIPTESKAIKNTQPGGSFNTIQHSFNVIICDLVKSGEENQIDVLSDTQQIAIDLITELEQDEWYYKNKIIIETDALLIPFYERFNDLVGGWSVSITILVPNSLTNCIVPIEKKTLNKIIDKCQEQ